MSNTAHGPDNRSSIQDRLEFVGLGPSELALVRGRRTLIEQSLESGLDRFYAAVASTPEAAAFFSSKSHMDGARQAQIRHWSSICNGDLDHDYVERVRAIGSVHAKIGLEPRWYIGGYAIITEKIVEQILEANWPKGGRFTRRASTAGDVSRLLSAILKSVLLDMDLSLSVYIDEAEAARKRVEDQAMSAVRTAVAAFGDSVSRLAQNDLTTRITDELPEEYAELKSGFNDALSRLDQALCEIRRSVETVASGTGEVRSAADDLSRRAERQAASVEEMAAAVEQITATVKSAASRAEDANVLVARARTNAEQSSDVVEKATSAMGRISQSSDEIEKIIGVIDEIAFQTNLLALNAGVEAARAGDAGKGFAVVAQEVRELAQRSAGAAKDIKQLIGASGTEVKEGVELVGQVGSALGSIAAEVQDVAAHVTAINDLMREQASALEEVNSSVTSADQGTQQNAALAEELTASSHSLASEVEAINRRVSAFRTQATERAGDRAAPGIGQEAGTPVARFA